MRFYALMFLLFAGAIQLSAQCTSGFSLGLDTSLCANQTLNLAPPNIYESYRWQNNSPSSSFLVTTAGTYYCETTLPSGLNLVNNGNFEQGNTGFTTDYTYYPIADVFGPQASYGVISNPNTWFNPFNPCPDHTSGTGRMMVVFRQYSS